jgi:hypothetical protein
MSSPPLYHVEQIRQSGSDRVTLVVSLPKKIRDSSTALGMTKRALTRDEPALWRRLHRSCQTPSPVGRDSVETAAIRATTERSRNRDRNFPKPKSYSRCREDRAWLTRSNPEVYARGGVLAQPLQWARDDTVATSGTKRPASMKTRRRTNYV